MGRVSRGWLVLRGIVWLFGLLSGVLAVALTIEYHDLVTGWTIVDFIPWETNGEQQRAYRRTTGLWAAGSACACLASFIVAFSGGAEK